MKLSHLTWTVSTDGSPLYKSSIAFVWPIQLYINELPQPYRNVNTFLINLVRTETPWYWYMHIACFLWTMHVGAPTTKNCFWLSSCRLNRPALHLSFVNSLQFLILHSHNILVESAIPHPGHGAPHWPHRLAFHQGSSDTSSASTSATPTTAYVTLTNPCDPGIFSSQDNVNV